MYVLCKQIVTERVNSIYATELIIIPEHCACIQAELPPVRAQPRHGPGQGRPGHGGRHEGGPQREAGGWWRRLTLVTLHTCYHQVIVGVCAMEKKTLSKPMKEILTRLEEFEHISTSIFPEVVILNVRAEHFLEYV